MVANSKTELWQESSSSEKGSATFLEHLAKAMKDLEMRLIERERGMYRLRLSSKEALDAYYRDTYTLEELQLVLSINSLQSEFDTMSKQFFAIQEKKCPNTSTTPLEP